MTTNSPSIFFTGATGYIGGDCLHVLTKAHPEWPIRCLIRDSTKGKEILEKFPMIKLVYGTLDDHDTVKEEARMADIILHHGFSSDHLEGATAIVAGIKERDRPVYWIHTSGTGILTFRDQERDVFGELDSKVFDDWDNIKELITLPDFAFHRVVDKIVLAAAAAKPDVIKTAIVCPPHIYGKGRGPVNQRSIAVYNMAKSVLQRKKGIQVGAGKNIWHWVHVHDLSELYLMLTEAAAAGGGNATWGEEGYYLAEQEAKEWGEVARNVAATAHKAGLIPTEEVDMVTKEETQRIRPNAHLSYGANSRGKAIRARKLFGWEPAGKKVDEEMPDIVMGEAAALGVA